MEQQLQGCIIIRRRRRRGVFLLSELPESLLLEILYRLPIKSVFKFKSVSKSWLTLISDPLFARSYYSRRIIKIQSSSSSTTNNPPWTILYRYSFEFDLSPEDMWLHALKRRHSIFKLPNFTLCFLSDARDDRKVPNIVLAVSNGLLLSTATRAWHDCYYISNPFTKQWSALPKPLRIHKWVSVGFIVEPIDGSFQVVRIGGYPGSSDVVNFEIFSSKTRQWKDKSASFNLPVRLFLSQQMSTYCHAVPCKKILHWMEYIGRIIAYDTSQTDTENDDTIRCRVIDSPGDRINNDIVTAGTIGVCQDHLRYCHVANWSQIENVRVWELRKSNNEGEGEWFLLYRMRLDGINMYQMVLPVAFHPLDPDIVYLIRQRRRILTNLNLRTRVWRDLVPVKGTVNCSTVFPFVLLPWPTPIPQISLTPLDLQ